jgi:hypothetical protein
MGSYIKAAPFIGSSFFFGKLIKIYVPIYIEFENALILLEKTINTIDIPRPL